MKWSTAAMDARIDEVVVDAYGEAEGLGAFACVLDELVDGGAVGSVLGERVELVAVSDEGPMLGLRATCRRGTKRYEVALFDVDLDATANPELTLTLAAYRRWVAGGG